MDFSKVGNKTTKKSQTRTKREPTQSNAMVVRDSLDIKKAQEQFSYALEMINDMASQVNELIVKDEVSVKLAISFTGQVKTLYNRLEAERKEAVNPALKFQRGINGFVKNFTEKLIKIERTAKQKIGDYQYKLELDRLKKAKEQADAQEKLKKKIEEEAKQAGVEAPIFELALPIKEEKTVARADDGTSAFIKKPWKGTIINPQLVPRKYCEPSQRLVNEAIKGGIREIPGVEIKQEVETSIRL